MTLARMLDIQRNKRLSVFLIIVFDVLVISAIYIVGTTRNIPLAVITRDPGATTGQLSIGMLSNLGIILWAAAAGICYLGAILLREIPSKSRLLFCSGLFTTLLLLDDAFMLHDEIIPRLFHIHEWPAYIVYLLLIVVYFSFFLRDILTMTEYPILLIALLFFGISVIWDVIFETFPTKELEPFLEDGVKFFGITLWLTYFYFSVIKMIKPYINIKNEA